MFEIPPLFLVIFFTLLGSVGSLLLSATLLLFPRRVSDALLPSLVSVAVGSLLGAAFLRILPEALESGAPAKGLLAATLGGILLFFILEKLVLWRHCHHGHHCEAHGSGGTLILIGDAFHNLVDGFAIGAAFLVDTHLGIAVALALIAHEVPQEVGDFAILLQSGYSKLKAFFWNLMSSLPSLVGALIAWFGLDSFREAIPYVLAVSGASFVYIATADLVPTLHKKIGARALLSQVSLIILGIALIVIVGAETHAH